MTSIRNAPQHPAASHRQEPKSTPKTSGPESPAAAWKAIRRDLFSAHGEYRNTPDQKRAAVWGQSQAAIAALDLLKVKGGKVYREEAARALNAMHNYRLPDQGYAAVIHPRAKSQQFMDDNTHVALAFLQGYSQLHDPAYLHEAEGIVKHLLMPNTRYVKVTDPKTGRTHVEARIPWFKGQKPPQYPVTVASRTVEVSAKLYQLTGKKSYLRYAEKACHFMDRLRVPGTDLYAHLMNAKGKVEGGTLSVMQGSVIGAQVSMYEATGQSKYLDQAKKTAAAGMKYFTLDRLVKNAETFNATYFRNLEKLRKYDPHNPEYAKSLNAYLDYAQKHGRVMGGKDRDFFDHGGLNRFGKTGNKPDLLDQAGMVQLLALQHLSRNQIDELG